MKVITCPDDGYYGRSTVNGKEQTTDVCNNIDEVPKQYAEGKKSDTEKYVLCDSTCMKF